MRTRRWTEVCFAVALVLLVPGTAWAHNFSGATAAKACQNNMADNREHTFSYNALTPALSSAVSWSRANSYDPTDLTTVPEQRPTWQTDVIVFDHDYEGTTCGSRWVSGARDRGTIGMALCQSLSRDRCQQFFVYIDTDYLTPATQSQVRSLACHELGHTVGLLHAGGGCLVTPSNGSVSLTAHDRTHINRSY